MKKIIGQPHFIKEVNIDIVESIIAEKGPVSKPEIAKITSLSLPTVNKVVDALVTKNRVKTADVSGVGNGVGAGAGRKAQFYVVNESSGYILALYFINDNYSCTVANAIGESVYKCILPVVTTSREAALESTYSAVDHLLKRAKGNAVAIGVGVPGVVKNIDVISSIPTIPGWEGLNLKAVLEEKYGIRTFVENDVKLTTVGFYHNTLKQTYDDMAYLYLGKGMGSGIIIGKKLFKGSKSFSGELGYMVLKKPSELERDHIKTSGLLEYSINESVNVLKSGLPEEQKSKAYNNILDYLSYCLNNLVCILNPEVIVLSGDLINEAFMADLKARVEVLIEPENMPVFMTDHSETSGISGIVSMCTANISSKMQLIKGMEV